MVEYRGDLDRVYGALSNLSRRQLLERLAGSSARVGDLAEAFDMTFAGVSKHIHVLEVAGLVTREVHGREHHLSLQTAPLVSAERWLSGYRSFWGHRLDLLDERIRESRKK
jgi:DNA-binding transcriptional ArsR family regulator